MLTSDGGRSVLDALMERDAEQLLERELQAHGSQAAAYIQLLRHFDDHMEAVALHLRVSVSYAYRRCAHARRLAQHLQHIAVPRSDALPGPWRHYRLVRQPIQLSFDFGEQLGLG